MVKISLVPNSAYIVYSQILGVGHQPFGPVNGIRQPWQTLFASPACFYEFRNLIKPTHNPATHFPFVESMMKKADPDWKRFQSVNKPFFKNLGPICFESRISRLNSSDVYRGRDFLESCLRRNGYQEDDDDYFHKHPEGIFGYDPKLKDQRMNCIYFRLDRPVFLKAVTPNGRRVEGKIFVHIYPSGYLTLQVAIILSPASGDISSFNELNLLLKQTRPWRNDTTWTWVSRLGRGSLFEIVQKVVSNLERSIFNNHLYHLVPGSWQSVTTMRTNADPLLITEELIRAKDKPTIVDLRSHSAAAASFENEDCSSLTYLIVSKQGLFCAKRIDASRRLSLRFFWKVLILSEFVLFKDKVYDDYIHYLTSEIKKLTEYRLSLKRKATQEDVRRFSVYEPQIPEFLLALDNFVKTAAPFHRFIYTAISTGTEFDAKREKLLELLKTWEDEVSKWEHGVKTVWKKIFSPLSSILMPKPQ